MSAPTKVILKFKKLDGGEACVVFDHIVYWETSGMGSDNSARLHLSNGQNFVVMETCAEIENHVQKIGRGGF